MLLEIGGEIITERMKKWSQSKNNTLLNSESKEKSKEKLKIYIY